MFLLDTNTVIHYLKGMGQVAQHLLEAPPSQVALPSVVVFELMVGVLRLGDLPRRREQLHSFLEAVAVAPFGHDEAAAAAQVRATLETRGTPIGPLDVLIAGTALAQGAILVTHNTREFGRVENLQLANWYD